MESFLNSRYMYTGDIQHLLYYLSPPTCISSNFSHVPRTATVRLLTDVCIDPPHAFMVLFRSSSTTRPAQNMSLKHKHILWNEQSICLFNMYIILPYYRVLWSITSQDSDLWCLLFENLMWLIRTCAVMTYGYCPIAVTKLIPMLTAQPYATVDISGPLRCKMHK